MKFVISYPPLKGPGVPLLGQNRQFQWFSSPTFIYPVVPASAATLLKQNDFEVVWNDSPAEDMDKKQYLEFLEKERPDVLVFETKTPVVKQHWKLIDELRPILPDTKFVLMGDHVTALPQESLRNSSVDYVLTGGDYDFQLLGLAKHLSEDKALPPGFWWKEKGAVKNTGEFILNHSLDSLPLIDRELTKWELYAYKNGNYKHTPGTYIMSGRDCWWRKDGGCTFCSWPTLFPTFRTRSVENVLDEIGILIEKYGVKEIFDDTGTFPAGKWLKDFCKGVTEREYDKKVVLGCNMRFGAVDKTGYEAMKKANFRFVLFGLESANQETNDRLNKGTNKEEIIASCRAAKQAGLEPHLTVMLGYPWEKKEMAMETVKLARHLLIKGWADTLQTTIVIPYPGSKLFREAKENGWLLTEDWDEYDMRRPVLKTPMGEEELLKLVRSIYSVGFNPEFLLRKLLSIRSLDDVKFFLRAGKGVLGHLFDFSGKKKGCN